MDNHDRSIPVMILHVKKHFSARASEWLLAGALATVGTILLRPEDIFSSSPVYVGLARIANENTWGWFCLVFGVIRIAALFVNGSWVPSSYHLRAFCAFTSCFFWFTFTLGLVTTDRPTLVLAIIPWLFFLDMCNCFRAANDAREMTALQASRKTAG